MEESKVLTADDESIGATLQALKKGRREVAEMTKNLRPLFGGERFLTDAEVAERLKVTRRTLQQYRNDRVIPFIYFGGKILYRETDLEKLLESAYKKALP